MQPRLQFNNRTVEHHIWNCIADVGTLVDTLRIENYKPVENHTWSCTTCQSPWKPTSGIAHPTPRRSSTPRGAHIWSYTADAWMSSDAVGTIGNETVENHMWSCTTDARMFAYTSRVVKHEQVEIQIWRRTTDAWMIVDAWGQSTRSPCTSTNGAAKPIPG